MNLHQILDQFEAAWAKEETPEVAEYIAHFSRNGYPSPIGELIKIDLERRWRSVQGGIQRLPLEYYLSLEPDSFSDAVLVELIGWEYLVRNRWGDCPTRTEIMQRFAKLAPQLDAPLKLIATEIPWPKLELTVNQQVLQKLALDGPVEIGRQRDDDPAPFSIVHRRDIKRMIVAVNDNSTISRTQLRIRLTTPCSVQLTNSSRNRALAICGGEAVNPDQTRSCELPVKVHLCGELFLQISE